MAPTVRSRAASGLLVLLGLAACGGQTERVWHEEAGHRWAALDGPRPGWGRGQDGFEQLDPRRTGVSFENRVTEDQIMQNEHVLNGSGLALGDIDGDGLPDLYFSRLDGPNVLYRNLGRLRFEQVPDAGGAAAGDRLSTGAAFADADNDGDLDLFVTSIGGPHSYFENDGAGRFTDRTGESGLVAGSYGTTMAFADVDDDGDLDLYVANNKVRTLRDIRPPNEIEFDRVVTQTPDGRYTVRPEFAEHYALRRSGNVVMRQELAEPDAFYLNDGTGRFAPVDFLDGSFVDRRGEPLAATPRHWGLSARFVDLDGDGDPDLYVCNDFESPDHVWINDGAGRFRELPTEALRTTSNANMAVDVGDVNRDGHPDLLTVDMLDLNSGKRRTQTPASVVMLPTIGEPDERQQLPRNVLLVNRGDGTFAETALFAGLEASGWTWSVIFLDVDLDGYEDVLIGNGHEHDFLDTDTRDRIRRLPIDRDWRRMRFLFPQLHLPNVAFRNKGNLTFERVADGWGIGTEPDVSHGMATGDLDGDGDLDVVANRLGAPAGIYENRSTRPRILVRLEGDGSNTSGVGAKIHVHGGAAPIQSKEVTLGGPYVSSSELAFSFAAGDATSLSIAVEWRDGTWSHVAEALPNREYVVLERGASPNPPDWPELTGEEPPLAWFSADDRFTHLHSENPYDDFRRQPLLPYKLSQGGPGLTWADLDGDGDEDLAVGSGGGGRLALFRNDGGRLEPVAFDTPPAVLDLTTILPLPVAGGVSLLIGQMNYEAVSPTAATQAASVLRLDIDPQEFGRGRVRSALDPAIEGAMSATGPLALADYDGDGDLDLFVGGRALPSRYPEPASSRLFQNTGGAFAIDARNARVLREIGLVSGAVFSDIDQDGDPDLMLAVEWGPITLLRNDDGVFIDATEDWGLAGRLGLWNGVTTGDLNADGRPDLVATNWGLNTRWRVSADAPLRAYFADFDRSGTFDVVLAQADPRLDAEAPLLGLDRMSQGLGFVRSAFPRFSDYANATLSQVLGPQLAAARRLEVTTLAHTVWLNRGDRFEAVELPRDAQLAPAFHAGIADANGDGHEDLFLTQNFYPTEEGTQRYHAGRALWLSGDGRGGLSAVSGQQSGVIVHGDQRGAAFTDLDGDGRLDLVVSQNAFATRLFRNAGARAGLRVRLRGPVQNPSAIGASMRVVYVDGEGPAREVQAGSGYWSMNGAVQVLGLRDAPRAVWVRWPDGTTSRQPVERDAREVTIDWSR